MGKIYSSAEELIGNTPIVKLNRLASELGLGAEIYAKLEGANPAGSAKDRVALGMLNGAIKNGKIKEDTVIIEPTSGNTGIGLSMLGAIRGYKTIIVMPDSMSRERIMLMRAYGAEVVLTPGALGMSGAIDKANELANGFPSAYIPSQFDNIDNKLAHYMTTGPEIYEDMSGNVDCFVAGVGTGGTISGVGKYLKEKNPGIRIVAIEPIDSPLLSGGVAGAHKLQGIGANFIPELLNRDIYDEVLDITADEAFSAARRLAKAEGILAGISSGAALSGAIALAQRRDMSGKKIVVLLPDSGERYLSGELFE